MIDSDDGSVWTCVYRVVGCVASAGSSGNVVEASFESACCGACFDVAID